MRELNGNIFDIPYKRDNSEAICVTTNCSINDDGKAVMEVGIAREFKEKFPAIDYRLALHLQRNGNVPGILGIYDGLSIISFPTKYESGDPSEIELVGQSARILRNIINETNYETIYLPEPGTGMGGLKWVDVRDTISPYLDDRFILVHYEGVEKYNVSK